MVQDLFCNECDQKFTMKEDLVSHQLYNMTLYRQFCNIVHRINHGKKNLDVHVKNVHVNKNIYEIFNINFDRVKNKRKRQTTCIRVPCDICGKGFTAYHQLRRHIKVVHQRIKSFLCDYCGKAFGFSSHLKRHVKTVHKHIKLFTCDICCRSFDTSSHLHRHVSSVHEHIKPYTCFFCKSQFAEKFNLKLHMRKFHII